jgi:putative restriction endonuclease
MKCMSDGLPVGVLLQVKPKPGVEYEILGLAAVKEWKDGYFILEGYSKQGELNRGTADAAYDYALTLATPTVVEDFKLGDVKDARQKQIAEVVQRRGQAKFRKAMIAAYGSKCVITGCDAVDALEAAHISPYRGELTNHPQNGLLLRADLHSLFDLGLLSIDPSTRAVVLSEQLVNTHYGELAGKVIDRPADPSSTPNFEALEQHMKWSRLLQSKSNRRSIETSPQKQP